MAVCASFIEEFCSKILILNLTDAIKTEKSYEAIVNILKGTW